MVKLTENYPQRMIELFFSQDSIYRPSHKLSSVSLSHRVIDTSKINRTEKN